MQVGALPLIEVLVALSKISQSSRNIHSSELPDLFLGAGGDDIFKSIPCGVVAMRAAIDREALSVMIVLIEVASDFCRLIERWCLISHGRWHFRRQQ